ncbi:signal transduction histidine kinase [Methanolinea mesophila]|uniref:cache domain-containing protein n=1 Tax=Methanolinea mesophila TaxID=547055 RepID=UPI001AE1FA2C|nr:cache domain-containing protein [Methanolinea mesophila]MBP1929999.1 signal transduction histidine kinase [Methanolinea mesophila]
MNTRTLLFVLVLFLAGGILTAGCIQNPGPESPGPSTTPSLTPAPADGSGVTVTLATPEKMTTSADLIAFVERAAEYARTNGRENALAEFVNPNGSFALGDIAVFAYRYDGTVLADPSSPGLAGTNILDRTDSFGISYVKNMAETARFGKGIVSYTSPRPGYGSTPEPVLAVVEDVNGAYYVGARMYASEGNVYPSAVLNASAESPGVDGLVSYVKEAVAYARENGRDNALAEFNNPGGRFIRGELVIMALDFNGTSLASPPYASELAENRINLINYQDPNGVATIRGMRDLSRGEGGFLYSVAKVTVDNSTVYFPKINYVEPVDENWWLFSAIVDPAYSGVAAGDLSGVQVRTHSRMELYDLVNRVVDYAKANGKEKTLAVIDDPKGQFVNGDLFPWAESADGVLLADPFLKSDIGQSMIDYTDVYGMKTTRVGIDAMQNGSGFSLALFPDTSVNGTAQIPKLIYMKPVDDSWWIGSGIYGVVVE